MRDLVLVYAENVFIIYGIKQIIIIMIIVNRIAFDSQNLETSDHHHHQYAAAVLSNIDKHELRFVDSLRNFLKII